MLELVIGATDVFNSETNEFSTQGGRVIVLEHSLVSLSKWESEFEKPFLGAEEKSNEETLAYVRHMILTPDFSPEEFSQFTQDHFNQIDAYINKKYTATWFSEEKTNPNREVITSELIYYFMIGFSIPQECERWNLNRLFTLIKVCNVKNAANNQKKKPTASDLEERRRLNAERKAKLGTRG